MNEPNILKQHQISKQTQNMNEHQLFKDDQNFQ
jgi:hypothetical protein